MSQRRCEQDLRGDASRGSGILFFLKGWDLHHNDDHDDDDDDDGGGGGGGGDDPN